MGGCGSGRRYRSSSTIATDGLKKIDVFFLRKKGGLPDSRYFLGSRHGSLTWSRGDEVSFVICADRLNLSFRHQWYCDPWEDMEQTVWFDRTPCNFGGERLWFFCPRCDTRVGVLYLGRQGFLCRHCNRVRYSSQRESYSDRMNRKARKIRKRLGASISLFEAVRHKPKGMHWTTFVHLVDEESVINDLWMLALRQGSNTRTR
jgi:hypothetical protein